MTLPRQIEEFAEKYFAAEERASDYQGAGRSFRVVDQKMLARECKLLLESGVVENMHQLTLDLSHYKPGVHPASHNTRLRNFAKCAGITYPRYEWQPKVKAAPAPVVHRAPTHYTAPAQGIRAELTESFAKWLSSGVSLSALQAEAQEALVASNHKIQVGKVTNGLQDLMRTTGMTPGQLADIARNL